MSSATTARELGATGHTVETMIPRLAWKELGRNGGRSIGTRSASNQKGAHMTFQEIIKLHPQPTSLDRDALLPCIEECLDCATSCTACADASLSEKDVEELVRVIRLCLDCADACDATGRIVTRQSASDLRLLAAMLEACSAACLASAEECELHAAHHEHCRVCAQVCRRCKKTCDDLLATIVVDTNSD
jgi:hypothetical protein